MTSTTTPPAAPWSRRDIADALRESLAELRRDAAELTPEQLSGPSLLPGWSRGHVLAHLCRNADAVERGLAGAARGEQVAMYPPEHPRDKEIEQGAGRPLDEQLADLDESAARLAATAAAMPEEGWSFEVVHRSGARFPAERLLWMRLAEQEYHHVDLDAGYTPAHWPAFFTGREIAHLAERFHARAGLPPTVLHVLTEGAPDTEYRIGDGDAGPALRIEGPARALVAWLSGRAAGDGLTAHTPDGARAELPAIPAMS
ncbi:maleylpyruvate isomerase family mycothiol-dependent enzyme [Phaeacidiphilus oryzae]|uniref:maleylpyruvate isomerase family mycothiol-dependent enzyme n=1 Tax=Phaeacidiphilus oryzae TaxID=348818 RepID=UPI00068EE7EC|nr:maleylpyruvate isomerase family mycothiol-dependent enzyme [Phaeacidiphilus oryzae]